MQGMIAYINQMKAIQIHSFFTVKGLECFIESGYSPTSPPQYALPFDMADRVAFLETFRNDIVEDKSNSRVINSSKISIAPNTSVQLNINSSINFAIMDESGMMACYIDESSINEAFSDFLLNLHETDYVYSKRETLEILDKHIRQ
jgi:hypothetical protein